MKGDFLSEMACKVGRSSAGNFLSRADSINAELKCFDLEFIVNKFSVSLVALPSWTIFYSGWSC